MDFSYLKKFYKKGFGYFANLSYFLRFISVKKRLVLFFVLLSSMPLVILGFFSYYKSSNAIENKIEFFSGEIFSLTSQNIRNSMNIMEEYFKELNNNTDVLAYMKSYKNNKSTHQSVNTELSKFLNSKFLKTTIKNCEGAFIISNGTIIGSSAPYQITRNIENIESYVKMPEAENGNVVWLSETLGEKNYFIVFSHIYNNISNDILGTLFVILNEDFFTDSYKTVQIADSSDLFIINSEGLVLSSVNKDAIPLYSSLDVINKADVKSSKGTIVSSGYMYCYSLIEGTDWFIVGTIPISYITEEVSANTQSQIANIQFLSEQANLLSKMAQDLDDSISFFKL